MTWFRLALLVPWTLLTVTIRRLGKGPRHPAWSLAYEVIVALLRNQTERLVHAPPPTARRMLVSAPLFSLRRHLDVETIEVAGLSAESMTPRDWLPGGPTLLYLHGGGYVVCSPGTHRDFVGRLARGAKIRCLSIDYRLAPEHPFPAAVDDAVAAYRALVANGIDPRRLCIGGDSAGGGLTLATLQRLRDAGDPMPAGAVLISPWVDLTCRGQSVHDNEHTCYLSEPALLKFAANYVQGADPTNPLISAIHANLRDLPPTLLLTGDAETLYSENMTLARRAREHGVDLTLHVGEGMVHVWPAFSALLPEGRPAIRAITAFLMARTHVEMERTDMATGVDCERQLGSPSSR